MLKANEKIKSGKEKRKSETPEAKITVNSLFAYSALKVKAAANNTAKGIEYESAFGNIQ